MIPILYEKDETQFLTNGLGRLRDCLSAVVTEERNSVYEFDFEYPVNGAHYEDIRVGRIVGVTHDDRGDIQPFDIVSYEKPIDGVVTFHCTHISYRLSFHTVTASNVRDIITAHDYIEEYAKPELPFVLHNDAYWHPTGIVPLFDGLPHSVRSLLGGEEGSILDTYGGEYEFDKWDVYYWRERGEIKPVTIRYGVNMLDYNEECSIAEAYSACIPYWTDGTQKVIGDRQVGSTATVTGRGETVPLDVSEQFESKPTKAQVNAAGLAQLNKSGAALPVKNITVEFLRLQDVMPELADLTTCRLCDSISVVFPDYNSSGTFKIVKVVWDVLADRYEEMELGALSTTLAEALGIDSGRNSPAAEPFAGDVTIGGNLTVNGTASISGLLSPAAISAGLFSVSEHTASLAGTAAGNRSTTVSATKSGYFPLGVVGELVTSSGAYSRGFYLTSRTQGSATVNFRIYATGSGAKECTAYVLWVKNTA